MTGLVELQQRRLLQLRLSQGLRREPISEIKFGEDSFFRSHRAPNAVQLMRRFADSTRMNFGAPILIIDDDVAIAEMVRAGLEAAGQSATIARNAFHGLRLAREVKPAAVVCDMKMPDMSGGDVLRELASDPVTAQIPRVLMTGYVDADRAHAHAFLLKPFVMNDMLQLLQRITHQKR